MKRKGRTETDQQRRKRPAFSPINEELSINKKIPYELVQYTLTEYIHPAYSEIARLVCKVWNDHLVHVIQVRKEHEQKVKNKIRKWARKFQPFENALALEQRWDSHLFGITPVDNRKFMEMVVKVCSEYTRGESQFLQGVENLKNGGVAKHESEDDRGQFFLEHLRYRMFPSKTTCDFVSAEAGSFSLVKWLHEKGYPLGILSLYYFVAQDNVEALKWWIDAHDWLNVYGVLLLAQGTVAKFSSISCGNYFMKLCRTKGSHGLSHVCKEPTLREMFASAAIQHGNLNFLKHTIGEFMDNPFFLSSHSHFMDEAARQGKLDILLWLSKSGMQMPHIVSIFLKTMQNGHSAVVDWMLEYKMPYLRKVLFDSESSGFREYVEVQTMEGMVVKTIQVMEKHAIFVMRRSSFQRVVASRGYQSAQKHIEMMEYLMDRMGMKKVDGYSMVYEDLAYSTALSHFASRGWMEELAWLRSRAEPWVSFRSALYHEKWDVCTWYLEEAPVSEITWERHWYSAATKAGKVSFLKKAYARGYRKGFGVVVPMAMVTGNLKIIKWVWSQRTVHCTKKEDWTVWSAYTKWSQFLSKSLFEWFNTHVAIDPNVEAVNSGDFIRLANHYPEWKTIVTSLCNQEGTQQRTCVATISAQVKRGRKILPTL